MTITETKTYSPALRMIQPARLGQPGSLEAIVDTVLQQGYKIFQLEVRKEPGQVGSWKPSVDLIYSELLPEAYETAQLHLGIRDVLRKDHLQLRFESSWDTRTEQPTNQEFHGEVAREARGLFSKREFDPEYYTQRLLDLGRQLYSVLQPKFGWLDRCHRRGYTTNEHIDAFALPHLYWANFFGTSYVQTLGEEFLLQAPVGSTEKLDDGGILYVLGTGLTRTRLRKQAELDAQRYFSHQ